AAVRSRRDVDILEYFFVHSNVGTALSLALLLLTDEQEVVEGLARPDFGDRRVIAAAANVLQPGPFTVVFKGGPAVALVEVFVKALAPTLDAALASLLAHLVGLLSFDQELALGVDHVGRPAQVTAVGIVIGAGIVGIGRTRVVGTRRRHAAETG